MDPVHQEALWRLDSAPRVIDFDPLGQKNPGTLPWQSNYINGIWAYEATINQALPQKQLLLQEFNRVLSLGGIAVIGVTETPPKQSVAEFLVIPRLQIVDNLAETKSAGSYLYLKKT